MENDLYHRIKLNQIGGRYITLDSIKPVIKLLEGAIEAKELGYSVQGLPISILKAGHGPMKILAWSQMHGNESTTTKAALDYLHFLSDSSSEEVETLLNEVSFYLIPILNPDGAALYTRTNANGVDLNRDALKLHEPESRLLRQTLEDIDPQYCFNLHDQRTLFSAGDTDKPATISFLAPSVDASRSLNFTRERSMKIITGINELLQEALPGKIGRYDDSFNPHCTGDQFQQRVPTILFEAGHYPGDYQREETRRLMFFAIRSAVKQIAKQSYHSHSTESYFKIPENHKNFVDILLRNVNFGDEIVDVGIQFDEKLKDEKVIFEPRVLKKGVQLPLFGHLELDCKNQKVTHQGEIPIAENDLVPQILLNGEKLLFKME